MTHGWPSTAGDGRPWQRWRLSRRANRPSPLEQLRRIQQHRATIGDQAYTGISRTTPEQLSLFEALKLPKPAKSAV
jgi:hypothetical protein